MFDWSMALPKCPDYSSIAGHHPCRIGVVPELPKKTDLMQQIVRIEVTRNEW